MTSSQLGTLTPALLATAMRWRCAVKRFDPLRRIPAETWNALEDVLLLSPSSFGLQPWRFVVVTDPMVKERLVAASMGQRQPRDASHHVAFAVRRELGPADVERWVARIAQVRGIAGSTLAGYRKTMLDFIGKPDFDARTWAARQTYIALGGFLTAAALLGVDACPMEGIDAAMYDQVLGLEAQGYTTVVACAAGYRAEDDSYTRLAKARYPKHEVVVHVGEES